MNVFERNHTHFLISHFDSSISIVIVKNIFWMVESLSNLLTCVIIVFKILISRVVMGKHFTNTLVPFHSTYQSFENLKLINDLNVLDNDPSCLGI